LLLIREDHTSQENSPETTLHGLMLPRKLSNTQEEKELDNVSVGILFPCILIMLKLNNFSILDLNLHNGETALILITLFYRRVLNGSMSISKVLLECCTTQVTKMVVSQLSVPSNGLMVLTGKNICHGLKSPKQGMNLKENQKHKLLDISGKWPVSTSV